MAELRKLQQLFHINFLCLQYRIRMNMPGNTGYDGYYIPFTLRFKYFITIRFTEKIINTMYTLNMNFKDNIKRFGDSAIKMGATLIS